MLIIDFKKRSSTSNTSNYSLYFSLFCQVLMYYVSSNYSRIICVYKSYILYIFRDYLHLFPNKLFYTSTAIPTQFLIFSQNLSTKCIPKQHIFMLSDLYYQTARVYSTQKLKLCSDVAIYSPICHTCAHASVNKKNHTLLQQTMSNNDQYTYYYARVAIFLLKPR